MYREVVPVISEETLALVTTEMKILQQHSIFVRDHPHLQSWPSVSCSKKLSDRNWDRFVICSCSIYQAYVFISGLSWIAIARFHDNYSCISGGVVYLCWDKRGFHRMTQTNPVEASTLDLANRNTRLLARIQRTLRELVPISKRITLLVHAATNRSSLSHLSPGMSLKRAERIMGTRTRTGSSGYFTNIVLENPHRRYFLEDQKGKFREVLLYLTDVMKLDGTFTDEKFTPVFFREGRLEGWGWNSLRRTIQGNKLCLKC